MKSPRSPQSPEWQAVLAVAVACAVILGGCTAIDKLPAGAQLQSSTFGIKLSPQAVDGTPLAIGSHSTIVTTAQPADAGPNLNRFEGVAPGIHIKSTVASGPVGEQLNAAGGTEAVRALVNPAASTLPTFPQRPAENPAPPVEQFQRTQN